MANWKEMQLRVAGEQLETVNITELMEQYKTVDFRLVEDTNGIERLHFVAANGGYISAKISPKVTLRKRDKIERIAEILTDLTLYFGESQNGPWLTFSENAKLPESATVSAAEVLKKMGVAAA